MNGAVELMNGTKYTSIGWSYPIVLFWLNKLEGCIMQKGK